MQFGKIKILGASNPLSFFDGAPAIAAVLAVGGRQFEVQVNAQTELTDYIPMATFLPTRIAENEFLDFVYCGNESRFLTDRAMVVAHLRSMLAMAASEQDSLEEPQSKKSRPALGLIA
jgi:hypothetical protein